MFDLSKVESDGVVDPAELTVITDKTHPLYDERVLLPFDENIVKGIMLYGVRDAIECVRDGKALVVVDGRQRRVNAIEANKRLVAAAKPIVKVRVRIVRLNADKAQALLNLKNEHRQADSPMTRARKMQQMIDHGYSESEVEVIFRFESKATFKRHLSLNNLCDAAATAYEQGKIPAVTAYEMARTSHEEQMKALNAGAMAQLSVTGDAPASGSTGAIVSTREAKRAIKEAARAAQGKSTYTVPGKQEISGALAIVTAMWKVEKNAQRKERLALVGHVLEYTATGEKHPDLEDLLKLIPQQ